MPLIFSKSHDNGTTIMVWHTTETNHFFESALDLYPEELDQIAQLSNKKKSEWFSSRYLLHEILGSNERLACMKDNYGKPYLVGSTSFISLSHSFDYSAAIVAKKTTGTDIQLIVPTIDRIKHKFLSEKELQHYAMDENRNVLHVYWGAKECLFKAYGKGSVDFKKDLYVEAFNFEEGTCIGSVNKHDFNEKFLMRFEQLKDSILVYIVNHL